MTTAETIEIMTLLAASYPDTFKDESADVKRGRVALWQTSFSDLPADLVKQVVQAHIISDGGQFFPSIATIRKKCVDAMRSDEERPMTDSEAWALVRKALGNSYYGAAEEFEKLPKLIRRLVGSPSCLRDWGQMPPESLSVEQSHFLRAYRTAVERDSNDRAIPEKLKAGIERAGAIAAGRGDPFVSLSEAAKGLLTAAEKKDYMDL